MWAIRGLLTLYLLSGLGLPAALAEERPPADVRSLTLAALGAQSDLRDAGQISAAFALHAAAIYNRPESARLLVGHGMPVDMRNDGGYTPLMVAAAFGNVEVADTLIELGADMTARNPAGHTPLHIAALSGQAGIARLLIAHGSPVGIRAPARGETPLHFAALLGRMKVISALAADGADINATDNDGVTPLQYARLRRQMGAVEALASLGARLDDLADAVNAGDVARVVELIAQGADVNALDLFGTPLHHAAAKGRTAIAVILIDRGADLEAAGEPEGAHPLHTAALNGMENVAQLLIDRGARVDARDAAGRTPLMIAANFAKPGMARLLLAYGADLQAMDDVWGDTPIHYAACAGDIETMRLLLAHGADVNAKSRNSGSTPMHYAAGMGRRATIELLLAEGARPNITDKAGYLPDKIATTHLHPQLAQWLQDLARSR
jgi:ankyrin repeat protein